MLMSKKNLVAIYEHLSKEGVMVAKKDPHAPKHPELDVPNLQVMKTLNSLKSRGYIIELCGVRQEAICMEALVPHRRGHPDQSKFRERVVK